MTKLTFGKNALAILFLGNTECDLEREEGGEMCGGRGGSLR